MLRVADKIIEPSKIFVGQSFKIKIKIEDTLINKKYLITENNLKIVTENNKNIITEWSE